MAKYDLNFGCVHFSEVCGVSTVIVSMLIAEQIRRASSKQKMKPMSNDEIDEIIERAIST